MMIAAGKSAPQDGAGSGLSQNSFERDGLPTTIAYDLGSADIPTTPNEIMWFKKGMEACASFVSFVFI